VSRPRYGSNAASFSTRRRSRPIPCSSCPRRTGSRWAPPRGDPSSARISGGVTSIRSGLITLPASGTLTLTARYYLAYLNNATADDYLRINVVVGTTKTKAFEVKGVPKATKGGAWATATVDLKPYAGKQIRLLVEAADAGTASMIEAGVDDVKIVRQQ
jgi:hypothetical protein